MGLFLFVYCHYIYLYECVNKYINTIVESVWYFFDVYYFGVDCFVMDNTIMNSSQGETNSSSSSCHLLPVVLCPGVGPHEIAPFNINLPIGIAIVQEFSYNAV